MSIAEIERFAADVKSSSALRAEAKKAQTDKSHDTPLACAVAFAVGKGYRFTVDEVKDHIRAAAKEAGTELSDAELDGIAAAGGAYESDNPISRFRPY
jgi:hypothetical protein